MSANAGNISFASESDTGENAQVRSQHFNQLTFDFLATGINGSAQMRLNSSENAAKKMEGGTKEGSDDILADGAVVTSSDLLSLSLPIEENEQSESLFGASMLVGRLESVNDSNMIFFDVADCGSLDFDSVDGDLFEERAICDSDTYSYDLTEEGFRVLKNGETFWEIPLTAGVYRLNGVVLTIHDNG